MPNIKKKKKIITEGSVAPKSQIQGPCKSKPTPAFGPALVPLREADYYRGCSEIRQSLVLQLLYVVLY